MNLQQMTRRRNLLPLQFPLRETPHATIETNRTCNIRCRHCYNLDKELVKSLDTVKREIDATLAKRNVQSLTLLGGEPTLHPDLAAIVATVKSRGRKCQLLTNGVVFLKETGDRLLDQIIAAGVDKIVLHVDSGQRHVHGDLERARRILFGKMEARKVTFSLALTIDPDSAGEIPSLVKRYARYRYFDGILSLVARDGLRRDGPRPTLENEYVRLRQELRLEPVSYVPSNLGEDRVRWLIYFYMINAATGKAYGLSSELCGLFGWIYRKIRRRRFFLLRTNPAWSRWLAPLLGLADVSLRPWQAGALFSLGRSSAAFRAIRFQSIIIQNPAEYDERLGRYEICYHCPDATLRNGRLTPVCIADLVSPANGDGGGIHQDLAREVHGHLGENAFT